MYDVYTHPLVEYTSGYKHRMGQVIRKKGSMATTKRRFSRRRGAMGRHPWPAGTTVGNAGQEAAARFGAFGLLPAVTLLAFGFGKLFSTVPRRFGAA
jgi:hypothetical protein